MTMVIISAIFLKLNVNFFDFFNKEKATDLNSQAVSSNNEESEYYHVRLSEGTKAKVVVDFNPDNTKIRYDLEISCNKISVTKERGDFDPVSDFGDVITDANGTIQNDYSYVVFNTTLTNVSGVDMEVCLGNMSLGINPIERYCEIRAYNSGLDDISKKDLFIVQFEKDLKKEYNLVFVLDDQTLNNVSKDDLVLLCSFVNNFPKYSDVPLLKNEVS